MVRLLLVRALNNRRSVHGFNDRAKSYRQVKTLILRARSMAQQNIARGRLRRPQKELLRPTAATPFDLYVVPSAIK
jgi:hypothetical protein